MIDENHEDEIPIIGSSRAEDNIVAENIGPNFYNYGIVGTRDNVSLMMVREVIRKNNNPKVILMNFDLEGITRSTGDYTNYLYNSAYKPIIDLLGSEYKAYYRIPVIKYYGQFVPFLDKYVGDKIHGRYTELSKKVPKADFDAEVKKRSETVTTFRVDTSIRNQMLNIFESNPNFKFVLVVGPYHQSYFKKYTNYDMALNYLNQLQRFKNVKVYNFSHLNYPDDYYKNTTHLSYKGACAFTTVVKDSLSNLTGLNQFIR